MEKMIPTSFHLAGMPVTAKYADWRRGEMPSREVLSVQHLRRDNHGIAE